MGIFLEKGDMVAVAAPSARFDRGLFDIGIHCLESMGFKVKVPGGIFGQHRYLAGADRERAGVVNDLFADPEVKGILSVRGGFGAMRILEYLDWDMIRANPTLFVGFSDASSLISGLVDRAGLAAVHGPNLVSLARAGQETLDGFFRAVTGGLSAIESGTGECLVPGKAVGRLVGGNLATLVHLVGTRFQPDFREGILFIEDVGEPAYKIDRMLTQMEMAGCFDRLKGVVTGSFEECANPEYIPEIISEIFGAKGIPVCMGLAAGHGSINLAMPMGRPVGLDADRVRISWEDV
ncbi:MAG: LD-carboxypeptidase [Desulfobacter sp.]|nr:MAG: LD-carboxypeptidase [Desulfobacter sp.]